MAQFTLIIRSGPEATRDPNVYHFPTAQDARDATGHPIAVVHPYDVMPVRLH